MEVSDTKSVILYQLHGTQAERTMGKLRFKDKGVSKLRVAPDCAFPIVRKHPYLGIILSYGALESHSITHRYNRAGQLFSRLRQVLSARHHLSRHTRRRLWLSTVWPCLKYGITALQLEAKDMVRIRGIVARHLRIVSGQLSKDTHVTTDAFLTELGFDPIALLSKEATANQTRFKALDRLLHRRQHLPRIQVCFSAIAYVHMVLRFNVHVSSVHKLTDVLHVGTLRVARSFGSRCSLVSIQICSLVQAMTMDVDQKLTHDQEEEREWEMYSAYMSTAMTTAPSTTPKRPLDEEVAQLWTLCHMMIRLMVRHEDSIKTLMLDTSFVIWMRTGLPGGVPEALFAVATKWKADRETTPPTSPLRLTLWMCVWREFLQRLQPARMTQEIQTNMKKLGFLTDEGKWNFLRWDPDQAKLIPDTTRPPLTAAAAIELVESVIRLATDSQLLTRFAPTRPLASELKGPSITFLASVSNRSTPSDQMHASLAELCGSACCQVIGMSIKPERLTRSPLAQQIYNSPSVPAATPVGTSFRLSSKVDDAVQLRMRLTNGSNLCYANASLAALLWCSRACTQAVIPRHVFTALEACILGRQPFSLWSLLGWQQLLTDWRNPREQHDAAEFVHHLQARMQTPALQGLWQARDSHDQVRDSGDTCPLLLTAPLLSHLSVQQLVDLWHSQAPAHALLQTPECLILQLARFDVDDADAQKVFEPVTLDPVLKVPYFSGHSTRVSKYHLRAAIVHIGPRMATGHYRAALFEDMARKVFYTDDNRVAKLAKPAELAEIFANAYLLCYTKEPRLMPSP
ncbi:unnamed protein product [Symbiodinium sp. CCMP2592]|nr:unnamed protein product [Symbiodinium sp. CCMP2592]